MAKLKLKEGAGQIVFIAIASALILGLVSGWVLMLLFGMFAGYLGVPGLAIGYWASYGIYLMTRFVFSAKASIDD